MSQYGSPGSSSTSRSRSPSPIEDRSYLNEGISYAEDDSFSQSPEGVHEYDPYDHREEFLVDEDVLDDLMSEQSIKRLAKSARIKIPKMSQYGSPGPSGTSRFRSTSPIEDRSHLNEGISYAEDDSFSQSPERVHEFEPYDHREEFLVDEDELDDLMSEQSIKRLKAWISHVYSKLSGYDYYSYELVELIRRNEPDSFITTEERPSVIVTGIKKIIRSLQDRFRQFDLGVQEISTLTGSRLGARIQAEAEKASRILERNEAENVVLSDSLKMASFTIQDLQQKLNDALSCIDILRKEGIHHEIPIKEKYFLEDLRSRADEKSQLESSLLNDLTLMNNELQYNARIIMEEKNEKMRLIAEMEKDMELEDGIKSALLSKIKTLESDKRICEEAVNEWVKSIKETVEMKKDEIERMKDMVKSMDNEIEHLKEELKKITLERQELDYRIALNQNAVQEKYTEIAEFDGEIAAMKEYLQELDQQYLTLSNEAERKKLEINSRDLMDRNYRSPSPSGSPRSIDRSGSNYAESMHSPKFRQDIYSPKYVERASSPIYPPSPEPPERRSPSPSPIPSVVVSPPPSEYPANTDFRQDASVIPSTQNLVRNRFNIGQNFNMHTVRSGTASPYRQVTRLETSQPAAGTSRMIDSPVHLQHTAECTPTHCVTPFISTTRYGYTDPTAKCLNLPPGDDLDIGSSLRKTLLLTSPLRKQPLLVNIDVQPQPLIETADGEQFVCDISLNLEDTNAPPIEPTYTYGVPPAVTPTTARRHGQFTPKSIFKKRHYNIRRIFGPQYESPDMPSKWSPHYLPFDSRSPITSFPPSPYYSDRSVSWERSYDTTFDDSMLNRTYDPQSGTSVMNRTFEGPGTSAMNRTFDSSPSPIIKPPLRRYPSPVYFDEPYDIDTASPVIKGPSYRSPVYGQSPLSGSPFSESDKTFDSSQSSPGRNFTQGSVLDRTTSPELDGSYDKSFSPRSDKSFNQSLSPRRGGTFNKGFSPRSDKSFNQSLSPRSDKSFNQSLSPRRGGTFNKSFSPRSDKSFNQSLSPRSDKSFNQSLSPRSAGPIDSSYSRLDGTFERSPEQASNTPQGQTNSSQLNGKFDDFSPQGSNGTDKN